MATKSKVIQAIKTNDKNNPPTVVEIVEKGVSIGGEIREIGTQVKIHKGVAKQLIEDKKAKLVEVK
jgi:hypothetical protein